MCQCILGTGKRILAALVQCVVDCNETEADPDLNLIA